MTLEEALKLIDSVLVHKRLNDVQEQVFRQCWEGLKYPEIARQLGYDDAYLRRVGCELWQLLSEGFGERVTKSNFRSVLRRHTASTLQSKDESTTKQAATIAAVPEIAIAHHTPPTTSTDPNFVGREGAIAHLNSLVNQGAKIITVCAPGGVGKTTLAWQYLHNQGFDKILEIWMAKEIQSINSVESEVERWLQQDFGEEPGRDFGVNLERLRQKLRDPNQRIGILIDNLEPALDKNGRFIETRRAYVDFLRVLADPGVRSLTLITSRERLCEPCIAIKFYCLEGLKEASWQECFSNHGIPTDSPALTEMHHAYGGNAKAMQILSSVIQIDFDGDLEAFWQENQADLLLDPTLENLVSEQFNRLQIIYLEAHRLLCRLGCFRYQDLPTVPLNGLLCLLWDVEEAQRKRVIKALKDRAFIEEKNSEYWLHPVIRSESIKQLKLIGEWRDTNLKAAFFWNTHIKAVKSTKNALSALEAYHHYINIDEFNAASYVIVEERVNSWINEEGEALGRSFFRLGLLHQIIPIMEFIVKRIQPGYPLCKIYNLLGDLYWIKGYLMKAIECHELSREISIARPNLVFREIQSIDANLIEFKFKQLEASSFLNVGLCKLDLWELEEAKDLFEEVLILSKKYNSLVHEVDSYFCLAFLNSCLGYENLAYSLAEKLEAVISKNKLSAWGTGYSFLFLGMTYKNLGRIDISSHFYNKAISFANDINYTQVKAKGLSGLAELYRKQKNYQDAILHHLEAIKLLSKIDVKCDLAEACFQFGLTYKDMGKIKISFEYRNQAIQLYEEIEAPRQVERVRLAFAGLEDQSQN